MYNMGNYNVSEGILTTLFSGNEIVYDDYGMPSVMIKIPKMSYADLGVGDSTATFPAFIINGVEKDYLWISKYQNVVIDLRAYSLPRQAPFETTMDMARYLCQQKGDGWHLMTAAEHGLVNRLAAIGGYNPRGNLRYGKASTTDYQRAEPAVIVDGVIHEVKTGTGPGSWSSDYKRTGLWDIAGNCKELIIGIRTYNGELQIIENNDAADKNNSQVDGSSLWKAIQYDGTLITPDGNGTTTGSLKVGIGQPTYFAKWDIEQQTLSETTISNAMHMFQFHSNVTDSCKKLMMAYGFTTNYADNNQGIITIYTYNSPGYKYFVRGGDYASFEGGIASLSQGERMTQNGGFRCVYYEP